MMGIKKKTSTPAEISWGRGLFWTVWSGACGIIKDNYLTYGYLNDFSKKFTELCEQDLIWPD